MAKVKGHVSWEKWDPAYGNASRPGLLSHGSEEDTEENHLTTTSKDFKWPDPPIGPRARKKALLRKFLYQEVFDHYLDKIDDEDGIYVMEKETTYKSEFKGGDFEAKDIVESADPEVVSKYPLYTDQAHSVYFDKIKNIKSNLVSYEPQAIFRKCSYFSRPFYAELEE